MRDYYSVLGVERWADAQAIKLAHRNLMRSLHPDSGAATPESVRRVKEINEAYNVLRDPRSKRAYDEGLSHNRNHVIAQYSRARRGSTAVTVASVVVISVSLVAIALVVNGLYPPDRKAASVATANDLSGPSPSNGPERRLARIGNLAKGPKTDPSAGVAGPALSNPNFAPLDTVPHENELGSTRHHFEWPKAPSRPSAHSASNDAPNYEFDGLEPPHIAKPNTQSAQAILTVARNRPRAVRSRSVRLLIALLKKRKRWKELGLLPHRSREIALTQEAVAYPLTDFESIYMRPARLQRAVNKEDGPKSGKKTAKKWVRLASFRSPLTKQRTTSVKLSSKKPINRIRLYIRRHDVIVYNASLHYRGGRRKRLPISGVLTDPGYSRSVRIRRKGVRRLSIRHQTSANFKGEGIVEVWGYR